MASVTAFISGVIRGGSSLTGPTKTGNTNGSAASNPLMGYSFFGAVITSTVSKGLTDVSDSATFTCGTNLVKEDGCRGSPIPVAFERDVGPSRGDPGPVEGPLAAAGVVHRPLRRHPGGDRAEAARSRVHQRALVEPRAQDRRGDRLPP